MSVLSQFFPYGSSFEKNSLSIIKIFDSSNPSFTIPGEARYAVVAGISGGAGAGGGGGGNGALVPVGSPQVSQAQIPRGGGGGGSGGNTLGISQFVTPGSPFSLNITVGAGGAGGAGGGFATAGSNGSTSTTSISAPFGSMTLTSGYGVGGGFIPTPGTTQPPIGGLGGGSIVGTASSTFTNSDLITAIGFNGGNGEFSAAGGGASVTENGYNAKMSPGPMKGGNGANTNFFNLMTRPSTVGHAKLYPGQQLFSLGQNRYTADPAMSTALQTDYMASTLDGRNSIIYDIFTNERYHTSDLNFNYGNPTSPFTYSWEGGTGAYHVFQPGPTVTGYAATSGSVVSGAPSLIPINGGQGGGGGFGQPDNNILTPGSYIPEFPTYVTAAQGADGRSSSRIGQGAGGGGGASVFNYFVPFGSPNITSYTGAVGGRGGSGTQGIALVEYFLK